MKLGPSVAGLAVLTVWGQASAAWTLVSAEPGHFNFIDLKTIRVSHDKRRVWSLTNVFSDSKRGSVRDLVEFDCKNSTEQIISGAVFGELDAAGSFLGPDNPSAAAGDIAPDTPIAQVLEAVCTAGELTKAVRWKPLLASSIAYFDPDSFSRNGNAVTFTELVDDADGSKTLNGVAHSRASIRVVDCAAHSIGYEPYTVEYSGSKGTGEVLTFTPRGDRSVQMVTMPREFIVDKHKTLQWQEIEFACSLKPATSKTSPARHTKRVGGVTKV